MPSRYAARLGELLRHPDVMVVRQGLELLRSLDVTTANELLQGTEIVEETTPRDEASLQRVAPGRALQAGPADVTRMMWVCLAAIAVAPEGSEGAALRSRLARLRLRQPFEPGFDARLLAGLPLERLYLFAERPTHVGVFDRLRLLELGGVRDGADLAFIGELPQLERLAITGGRAGARVTALTTVGRARSLRELRLAHLELHDLRFLAGLELATLGLRQITTVRLDGIEALPSLRLLSLANVAASELVAVRVLPALERLDLTEMGLVCAHLAHTPIRFLTLSRVLVSTLDLRDMPRLRQLVVDQCAELEAIGTLEGLPSLVRCSLTKCPKLMDIRGLAKVPTLTELHIDGCGVQ